MGAELARKRWEFGQKNPGEVNSAADELRPVEILIDGNLSEMSSKVLECVSNEEQNAALLEKGRLPFPDLKILQGYAEAAIGKAAGHLTGAEDGNFKAFPVAQLSAFSGDFKTLHLTNSLVRPLENAEKSRDSGDNDDNATITMPAFADESGSGNRAADETKAKDRYVNRIEQF